LPNSFKNKLNLPTGTEAIEISFLAVDIGYRERDFGEILLMEAISQVKSLQRSPTMFDFIFKCGR
jgi:ribosomal protein S18 acetylase RimI-like enzyme